MGTIDPASYSRTSNQIKSNTATSAKKSKSKMIKKKNGQGDGLMVAESTRRKIERMMRGKATAQTKQAVCIKEALCLELNYKFVFIQSGDIETELIHKFEAVGDSMLNYLNQIIDLPENIFDVNDDIGLEKV
ncbi:MAG: hypothetical protein EZS28_009205 [Streblomastix strix]|uniref:Uncharacterized protein n=1 Tax=Streblomastix strix TaxID=222440 RepID=A0A5J4WK43_9EUKA|nr:MAG: hypothetical protein EZS28_009205 [Streblomastix strix]